MARDAVKFARFAKFSCRQICSFLGAVDKAHKFDLIIYRRQNTCKFYQLRSNLHARY
ncbi:hypothetical protein CAMSH0001_1007 [Campylobacter showae RM3277]|uniref:Uncharacterized protein n=1 Tax=Campylobacter showae RM3277 TaxID=553219 RepID=C6RES4_9BACT|nr:hypothetical protein CAMSH0001_1007 [Campylobacter showae RM3277]